MKRRYEGGDVAANLDVILYRHGTLGYAVIASIPSKPLAGEADSRRVSLRGGNHS